MSFSVDERASLRRPRRRRTLATLAAGLAVVATATTASADPPADPLHGGQGRGVQVVGHTDLGGNGLNADVAVLGDHAFVGAGTNGGFAAQWNKTPRCKQATALPTPVKVVSLADPADPKVVTEILLGDRRTVARDVAVLKVAKRGPSTFEGSLLAVAFEGCQVAAGTRGGVRFFDVSNPALPVPLGVHVNTFASREVALVQRADGRVLALTADQAEPVKVLDVSNPLTPLPVGSFNQPFVFSSQECRPFAGLAQGVSFNGAGTRAYVAFYDSGLHVLDVTDAGALVPVSATTYAASDEGNSFRFVANDGESVAVATDEDLLPAKTTVTVNGGTASEYTEPGGKAPGVFRGCEAVWGSPLFEHATPSLTADVVFVPSGGCDPAIYAGRTDVQGKVVLVDRGGAGFESPNTPCFFDEKARRAQEAGAIAVLVANTVMDHHGTGGSGRLFSSDANLPADANVTIPVVMITKESRDAMFVQRVENNQPLSVTVTDNPDTWGALRVLSLAGGTATQVATFGTQRTTTLTPGNGRYDAVQPVWAGRSVLVSWMSDGLRVVDLSTPSTPRARAFFVPPAAADRTGNYDSVPLIVGVAKFGSRFVATDINGGLYVLDVVLQKSQCTGDGWQRYGFKNQGQCTTMFDDAT